MSDGPHRSLKMKKPWRGLAERADNLSYSQSEVDEHLSHALASECKELPRALLAALRKCFGAGDQASFIAPPVEAVEMLRSYAAGHPLGNLILDYAEQAAAEGLSGAGGLRQIFRSALEERTQRGLKQVEEHYRRESTARRADRLYERLECSRKSGSIVALAGSLVDAGRPVRVERPRKARGIDEGVALR